MPDMDAARNKRLMEAFVRMQVGNAPSDRKDLPIVDLKDELVGKLDSNDTSITQQFNEFRTLAEDRETQYNSYDEMATDSVIAAALEIYADDATAYDEQGRIIWVESEDENITKAGNRLLNILEIPERAWKHIYMACKYGDFYLKMFRENEIDDNDPIGNYGKTNVVKVVNDKKDDKKANPLVEYVEDVDDPATVFDLRKRGKTAGFIQVRRQETDQSIYTVSAINRQYSLKEVDVYKPDRMVHIAVSETLSRTPETVTIKVGEDGTTSTYEVNRGKSVLYDVYPVQREIQLLEDSLVLNRLTRSSLIRILEIEVGDMPKKEVNDYLRRIKNLVEQHIAMDKGTGTYKSFQSPGPIDNVIYVPTKGGKGGIQVNNLGGDVNVRDIVDIEYFNNKRSGALKIPRAYLGDDMEGSGLSNGGSLTKLSARYARTIKRIQTSYIRAITTMLNLFFIDKKLDYVNKFTVRMTSPSTQEDLERNELILGNIDLIESIMSLMGSLEGGTQKKILNHLIANVLKMPEVAEFVKKDGTPEEDVDVDASNAGADSVDSGSDVDFGGDDVGGGSAGGDTADMSDAFGGGSADGGFTDDEYSSFEDSLPT